MARRARLQEFLGRRYTDSKELRAFVDDTFGTDAVNSIGWEEGVNDETSDLIRWLESRGKMTELWPALKAAFPSFSSEIDVLAAEWKPGPLAKLAPGFLRKRPVQIGIGAVVLAGIAIGVLLWMRDTAHTAVLVLDGAARDELDKGERFAVVIDDSPRAIGKNGVAIGKGPLLPDAVAERYKTFVPTDSPTRLDVRLTGKRAASLRITMNGKACATPFAISASDDGLYVVALDHCKPLSKTSLPEAPRPTIGVRVSIEDSGKFVDQLEKDLKLAGAGNPRTAKEFLVSQLIEQLEKLQIFDLEPANPNIPAERTLVGTIRTQWPNGDVTLRLKLGNEPDQPLRLFEGLGCASPVCDPKSLVFGDWYDTKFRDFGEAWPPGFLKSVVLTSSATIDGTGNVRTVESLDRFGQTDNAFPRALFEIAYGTHHRPFLMCQAQSEQPRGLGIVVKPDASTCWREETPTVPSGRNGKVTLVKVLRW